jgi:hypothetical protein
MLDPDFRRSQNDASSAAGKRSRYEALAPPSVLLVILFSTLTRARKRVEKSRKAVAGLEFTTSALSVGSDLPALKEEQNE